MSALMRKNGAIVVLPWALPRSVDEHGDTGPQGRFCVAYSRDGWFLLDSREWRVLRWSADESDILAAQVAYPALGRWASLLVPDDHQARCSFCDRPAGVYHDDHLRSPEEIRRVNTCTRHDRFFHASAW